MANSFSIDAAHVLAVLAGVVFGSGAISTACWVWLKRQIFAFGGSALCGSGVVLLGLSIWHSVEFGVSGSSISLKLQAALEQLQEIRQRELASFYFPGRIADDPLAVPVSLAIRQYFTSDQRLRVSAVLGETVYDEHTNQIIGVIEDVLTGDNEHKAGTAVISVPGSASASGASRLAYVLGPSGETKLVAVPLDQLKVIDNKIILSGSTLQSLQSEPAYTGIDASARRGLPRSQTRPARPAP